VKPEEVLIESTGVIGQRIKKVNAETAYWVLYPVCLCPLWYCFLSFGQSIHKILDRTIEKHSNKLKFCCFNLYTLILFAGGAFKLTSHSSKFTVIFSWGVIPVLWFNFTFNLYNWHAIMLRNSHFFYVWLLYDLCICVVFFLPSSHHFGFLIFEKYIALNNTCCVYFSFLFSSNLISLHSGQILQLWQSPLQILLARVWQLSLWYFLLLFFAHLF